MTRMIALLTDFGTQDIYVGVMKGVMKKICPEVQFLDVTHAIQPQNVRQAAFALLNAYAYFPVGTIFLVVVDPGVGSARHPIAVQTDQYAFIAPDNGVLTYTLAELNNVEIVELANPAYHLNKISQTFHGRDIFAPAAAHLAAGVYFNALGASLEEIVRLPDPQFWVDGSRVVGEVLHIDHFGNVITSISRLEWLALHRLRLVPRFGEMHEPIDDLRASKVVVEVKDTTLTGIKRSYSEVGPGEILVLIDNSGYLELAVNQGSCAERLGISTGERVELHMH